MARNSNGSTSSGMKITFVLARLVGAAPLSELSVRADALTAVTVIVKQKNEPAGTTTFAAGENGPVLAVPKVRVVADWAIVVGLVQLLDELKAKFKVTPVVFPATPVVV